MAGTLRLTNTGGASGQTTITAVGTTDRTVNTPDEDGTLLVKDPSGNFAVDGDVQMASQNGGPLAGFRNQFINGGFRIWQRGDSTGQTLSGSGGTRNYFGTDRWWVARTDSSGGTANVTQRDGSTISGASNAVRYGNFNADASNYRIGQCIELNHPGKNSQFQNGTTWTFSIYSDTDLTSVTPAFGFATADSNFANMNIQNCTVPAFTSLGGDRYGVTFTIDANAAVDSVCLLLRMSLAPAQAAGRIDFANAQLEPGPVATPFEHRPIGTELALCQRYYVKEDARIYMFRTNSSESTRRATYYHPTTMRATPTLTFNNTSGGTVTDFGNGSNKVSGFTTTTAPTPAAAAYIRDLELDAEL